MTKVHYKNQNGDQDGYCSPGSGRLLTFSSTDHYKNQNGDQDGYCSPGSGRLPTFSSTGHYKNQNGDQDGYCSPGSGRLLTFSSTCYYKGIKKLQKVNERPRLSITIDVLRMPISFLSFGCFGQCDDRMYRLIQAMGRWSSECYKRYIRLTKTSLRQARLGMAHTTPVR